MNEYQTSKPSKEIRQEPRYLKSVAPAALCGYFLGVGGLLAQQLLGLSIA